MRHPDLALKAVIEACDRAISQEDYDTLMSYYAEDAALVVKPGMVVRGKENIRKAFIAIADYFQHRLVVTQGKMEVIEGGGNALVIIDPAGYPDGGRDIPGYATRHLCLSEAGRTLAVHRR